jgi:hypothetical protein
MNDRPIAPLKIDKKMLADYPELAVLTLDLPDNDGEPMENERERLQINLILDVLYQHWKDRLDFYAAGNMFLYYCAEQARQIIEEVAEPSRPRHTFRGPDMFIVVNIDGSFRRQKWVVWEEGGRYPYVIFDFLSPSTCQADLTMTSVGTKSAWRCPGSPGLGPGRPCPPEPAVRFADGGSEEGGRSELLEFWDTRASSAAIRPSCC